MNFIFLYGHFINLDDVSEISANFNQGRVDIVYKSGTVSDIRYLTSEQITDCVDKIAKRLSIKDGD